MRRVVLHMGLPKTGSSALQIWLVRNRDWLLRHGVHYPEFRSDDKALRNEPVTGNGIPVLRYLVPDGARRPEASARVRDRVLADLRATDADTVVYSNEWIFNRHRADRLRLLRDELAAVDVRLQAAVYVRDVLGFALSAYAQQVKTALRTDTFAEYVDPQAGQDSGFRLRLDETLGSLLDLLGEDGVIVRHYDSARRGLVADFVNGALGVGDGPEDDSGAEATTNRSLTVREIEWKRRLNARLTTRAESGRLGVALIRLPAPEGAERLGATAADLTALHRYDAQVAWVNRTFFAGAPVLSVAGDLACVPAAQQPLQLSAEEQRLLDVLATTVTGDR